MSSRSDSGTRGTGRVSIERTTTCSWSECRCSTFARIASGAVVLPRFMNTAVPGTRTTGGSCARQLVDELLQRALDASRAGGDQFAPAEPGDHHREQRPARSQRQPGAV